MIYPISSSSFKNYSLIVLRWIIETKYFVSIEIKSLSKIILYQYIIISVSGVVITFHSNESTFPQHNFPQQWKHIWDVTLKVQ